MKDLCFERQRLIVRDGKGKKDRATMLPPSLHAKLKRQLRKVRAWHAEDLEAGVGEVYLPRALRRKYPSAAREWAWHWVFASKRLSKDPRSGKTRRHHLSRSFVQKRVRQAVKASKIEKKASCHTLRHSFTSLRFVNLPAVGLPRTFSKTATTCVPCSAFSATKAWRRRWSTRMWPSAAPTQKARWSRFEKGCSDQPSALSYQVHS